MPQDDAPPAGVACVVACLQELYGSDPEYNDVQDALHIFGKLRTLPAADRHALAEWIAPPGMVPRVQIDPGTMRNAAYELECMTEDFAPVVAFLRGALWAMLAAAKEASDG